MNAATQTPVRSNVSFKSMRPTNTAAAAAKKPGRSFINMLLKALSGIPA